MEANSKEASAYPALTETQIKEWGEIKLEPNNIPSLIGGIRSPDPHQQQLSCIIIERLLPLSSSTIIDFFLKGRYASGLIQFLHQIEYSTFISYTDDIFLTIIEKTFMLYQLKFDEVKGVVLLLRTTDQKLRNRTIDIIYQIARLTVSQNCQHKLLQNNCLDELLIAGHKSKANRDALFKVCDTLILLCLKKQKKQNNNKHVARFFLDLLSDWKKGQSYIKPAILFFLGIQCESENKLAIIISQDKKIIKNMTLLFELSEQHREASLFLLTKILKNNSKVLDLLFQDNFSLKIQTYLRNRFNQAKGQLYKLIAEIAKNDETAKHLLRPPNIWAAIASNFQRDSDQQLIHIAEIFTNMASLQKLSYYSFQMIIEKKITERLLVIIPSVKKNKELFIFTSCLWNLLEMGQRNMKKDGGNRIAALVKTESSELVMHKLQSHSDQRVAEIADRIILIYFQNNQQPK